MVLLVFLAIVWAAVGVYWLKTRVPTPSMAVVGGASRRRSSLELPVGGRRPAKVVPLQASHAVGGASFGGADAPTRGSVHPGGQPGHSLVQPARQAETPPARRPGVSSEQARIRRRNVLLGLVVFAAATLVGAFVMGGSMILLHLIADALLLGFILLIVQYQREIEFDRTQHLPVYAEPRAPRLAATGTD